MAGYGNSAMPAMKRNKTGGKAKLWSMFGLGSVNKGDANIHRDGRQQATEFNKYKGIGGV